MSTTPGVSIGHALQGRPAPDRLWRFLSKPSGMISPLLIHTFTPILPKVVVGFPEAIVDVGPKGV